MERFRCECGAWKDLEMPWKGVQLALVDEVVGAADLSSIRDMLVSPADFRTLSLERQQRLGIFVENHRAVL